MDTQTDVEYSLLLLFVILSLAIRHKALGGTGHGSIQESQHSYHSSHYTINAKVRGTQHVQYKTGGIERQECNDRYAEIQEPAILYDSGGCGGHGDF